MKICVIADTHSEDLPQKVVEEIKNADCVIHAGDFCCMDIYEQVAKLNTMIAVRGNMDDPDVAKKLPEKEIRDIEGRRIGVYHGHGAPDHILDAVRDAFSGEKLDAVIFGHSHRPMNERIDETLYFNPGSATDKIFAPYNSYGILTVTQDSVEGEIVKLD